MDIPPPQPVAGLERIYQHRRMGYTELLNLLQKAKAERGTISLIDTKKYRATSVFNRLPPEIRHDIFKYAVEEYAYVSRSKSCVCSGLPGLIIALRTDQTLYEEALEIFYKLKVVTLRPLMGHLPSSAITRHAIDRIEKLKISLRTTSFPRESSYNHDLACTPLANLEKEANRNRALILEEMPNTNVKELSIVDCPSGPELRMWLSRFENLRLFTVDWQYFYPAQCRDQWRWSMFHHDYSIQIQESFEDLENLLGVKAKLCMVYGGYHVDVPLVLRAVDVEQFFLMRSFEVWRWEAKDGGVLGCAKRTNRITDLPEEASKEN